MFPFVIIPASRGCHSFPCNLMLETERFLSLCASHNNDSDILHFLFFLFFYTSGNCWDGSVQYDFEIPLHTKT